MNYVRSSRYSCDQPRSGYSGNETDNRYLCIGKPGRTCGETTRAQFSPNEFLIRRVVLEINKQKLRNWRRER